MKRCWVILILSACGTDGRSTRDSSVDTSPDVRDDAATIEPSRPSPQYAEPRRSILSNEQVGRLAIPFQENDGQWDSEVAFKADHFAGSLWVTTDGSVVYSLLGPEERDDTADQENAMGVLVSADPLGLRTDPTNLVQSIDSLVQRSPLTAFESSHASERATLHQRPEPPTRAPGWTLVEHFVHGHPHRPRGLDPAVTNVSYFIGNDESKWAPHVSTFGALTLGEVWPGIEVRLVARGNNVEKFFHVEPHGDPSLIEMRLQGSEPLRLAHDGALIVTTGNGEVAFSPPVAFQVFEGERREVEVRYRTQGNRYGFELGPYDHFRTLIIDPLLHSTYVGGSGDDGRALSTPSDVAVDRDGGVLLVSSTSSSDFPGTTGGAQPAALANGDAVVLRLNETLSTILQATYVGGNGTDNGTSIAVDSEVSPSIYVALTTTSNDLPGRVGGYQPNLAAGSASAAVFRLAADLRSINQSTYFGGNDTTDSKDLLVDSSGDIVLLCVTTAPSLPGTVGGAQPSPQGGYESAVARFAPDLRSLRQATFVGGSLDDFPYALAEGAGIIVVGETQSADLPGTLGGAQSTKAAGTDAFVLRLSSDLTSVVHGTYLGGASADRLTGVEVSVDGDVFVAGQTTSVDFPGTAGGAQPGFAGVSDVVVARFNNALSVLEQATYEGGSGSEFSEQRLILGASDVFVTGRTNSSDFLQTLPGFQAVQPMFGGGPWDITISRFNYALTTRIGATFLGGSGSDEVSSGVLDQGGNLVLFSDSTSDDFPVTSGAAQNTRAGGQDLVAAILSPDLGACLNDAQCEDNNACTTHRCSLVNLGYCEYVNLAAGSPCRPSSGVCDPAENCLGGGRQCPADVRSPLGTTCRFVPGGCDLPEVCDGSSAACPSDQVAPMDSTCRNASGECDVPEVCSGSDASCPPDLFRPMGTPCAAGTCNGGNICAQCASNADCPSATPVCDPNLGRCAACNEVGVSASCTEGTFCDAQTGQCLDERTCDSDGDCAAPRPLCDVALRRCFGCLDEALMCSSTDLCDPDTGRCGLDPNQDADDDGILNGNECTALRDCPDTDGDTIPDYLDSDDDGDSIPTSTECPNPSLCLDTDSDGTANYLDSDDDGDGIITLNELSDGTTHDRPDADLDGVPNHLDTDSDGDESSDRIEGRNAAPSGIPFYLEVNFLGGGGIAGGALRCSMGTPSNVSVLWLFCLGAIGIAFVRRGRHR